jgi:hypothetical protein
VADAAAQALSFGKQSAVSFAPEIHRFVTEALCRAAEGVADEAALDTYVRRVLTAAGEALVRCASNGEDMKHPLGEARAVAALEALRGAARASAARSQRSVFVFFSSNFEALVVTQRFGEKQLAGHESLFAPVRGVRRGAGVFRVGAVARRGAVRALRARHLCLQRNRSRRFAAFRGGEC